MNGIERLGPPAGETAAPEGRGQGNERQEEAEQNQPPPQLEASGHGRNILLWSVERNRRARDDEPAGAKRASRPQPELLLLAGRHDGTAADFDLDPSGDLNHDHGILQSGHFAVQAAGGHDLIADL